MLPIFDLLLQLNLFPISKAKAALHKISLLSPAEKELFIERQKRAMVAFHVQNNAFYGSLVPQVPENWTDLPILNKKNLQIPLAQRLSKGYTKGNSYCNKTSGSSGIPFIFAKDRYCHALTWASNFMRYQEHGIDLNTAYQARFYGIPMAFWSHQKERLKDLVSQRYRFAIFDLSDAALETILKKFSTTEFDYINGYTSAIVLFAKFLEQKNVVLKRICPTLKVCMVTSEMLFEKDKILLEKQLGIPVVNEYGASELDIIAFENPESEWLVNSETLFVEILDQNNAVVPYGHQGRVVVTSLFNKAHPFIRYDTGDIGILDVKSTLDRPVLKKLIGRSNDIVVLPSGKKAPGLTFYYITKTIIEDTGNVKEFVITQTKINSFEIEYVSDQELNSVAIQKIQQAIETYLEPNLHFIFTPKKTLLRTHRGKLKQFRSML
ncbi:phenylacetate--CoA ligase family protein [Flavobacterium crassostreae]|uniref:AMP-binding protein n=1 Tax=Flavobacterium crassostreae TaxID=1763534 RepID=A0A1B9E5M3_9FLAO|nr:phenylacetate--CoA ligase family protein [Flavobacterium crassostreae]OCB77219.1 AMP-binding protein [Flavobacterium crassostreae]